MSVPETTPDADVPLYDELILRDPSVCSVCYSRLPTSGSGPVPAKDQTRIDRQTNRLTDRQDRSEADDADENGSYRAKICVVSKETHKAARGRPRKCEECGTSPTRGEPRSSPAPTWKVKERAERLCDKVERIGYDVDRETLLEMVERLKRDKHRTGGDTAIFRAAVREAVHPSADRDSANTGRLRPDWLHHGFVARQPRVPLRYPADDADAVTWGPYRWAPIDDADE